MKPLRFLKSLSYAIAGLTLLLQGCASAPARLNAVPVEATMKAQIPGMPGVRFFQPEDTAEVLREATLAFTKELKAREAAGAKGSLPPARYLALSGGGDDGAYGAGILCGWTAAGDRPEFKLVTGISTGAMIAPFAFLGPKYDGLLRKYYTGIGPADVLEKRGVISGLLSDAFADNAPLKRLVRNTITPDLLKEIAGEYAKGRLLFIATSNLDARRPVIWNMTKIAASGAPGSLELFQDLIVASAAIPGAFPPTMIDVEVDGRRYQEMHVDGGAFAEVFVYPVGIRVNEEGVAAGAVRERAGYIIRNTKLAPTWSEVERSTLTILQRAINILIQMQGIGDLYRIYAVMQRDKVDFNFTYIPGDFNVPHREEFDTEYMRALFDLGYGRGAKGHFWEQLPPGMDAKALR